MTSRRKFTTLAALAPLLGLVFLVAVATWKLTAGSRIIARGDLLLYFYPLRDYASQAVREGRLPLWNPYIFMGAPFLANSQVGFFYPFNLLMAWLPVEVAVSWSIALHLAIAALGTYALAWRTLGLGRSASFAAGLAFGLGGYLGAQAEHLNQIQVLAWLPWTLWLGIRVGQSASWRAAAGLALVVALQILAGHAQSLYISLVGLLLTLGGQLLWNARRLRLLVRAALVIAGALALAALICAVQLLPTLELAGESARAGGLPFNEAGSFSWRPWVAARALMPTYGDPLFPEYVTYLGAAGMALAALGALGYRRPAAWPIFPVVLAIAGFILALGVATPLFGLLYRLLPGFSLFRAQARWLVLFALGAALLVGLGVQQLRDGLSARRAFGWRLAWFGWVGLWIVGLLVGARISPEDEYRALPTQSVLLGWAIALGAVTSFVLFSRRLPAVVCSLALAIELLVASQFQPYARATDRQALTSLRPATAHLLAGQALGELRDGRVLALSSLVFDPGDKAEQALIYGPQLSADELYDRLIATKHREILSPNLSLYYRLPSVDGYDGGLLPTRQYAQFVRQFAALPEGALDGRLREFLTEVPAAPWLDRMAVRTLIADKTQDVFFDGVYYDLLFSVPLSVAGVELALQPFAATALGLVWRAEAGAPADGAVAEARLSFDDGSQQTFALPLGASRPPYFHARLVWGERKVPVRLWLRPLTRTPVMLRGLSSIDETDGAFLAQVIVPDLRLVHSGDVKLYERPSSPGRAVLRMADGALIRLQDVGGVIADDKPEFIRIALPALQRDGVLILRDACFPGWTARVDGVEVPIACEDILFRAVRLPAGAREVVFSYQPASVRIGAALSAAGIALWLGLALAGLRFTRR
jgi:hypothetical protein